MSTTLIHHADLALLRELAAQTGKEQTAILHEALAAYVAVMSERKAWLYANPDAMGSVLQGLREAAAGEVHSVGSFVDSAANGDRDESL